MWARKRDKKAKNEKKKRKKGGSFFGSVEVDVEGLWGLERDRKGFLEEEKGKIAWEISREIKKTLFIVMMIQGF